MDSDDKLVGRVLSRREALRLLGMTGVAGAAFLVGCEVEQDAPDRAAIAAAPTDAAIPTADAGAVTLEAATATLEAATADPGVALDCVVRPALTEGPYFVDERLNRSDIRSDPTTGAVKEGVPLRIVVQAMKMDGATCAVYPGVTVDVWHCDALGVYSDVQDRSFNTVGQKFLRGYQVTDENGQAAFTTIYPGWYQGRAVHIHFKLRTDPDAQTGSEFTSQWFFDESLTDVVHAQEPYASKGYRTLKNEGDGIYQQAGEEMILRLTPEGDGYLATFTVGIDGSGA
jgi:protocatechuate 3,4-dioxygenase beta subunit